MGKKTTLWHKIATATGGIFCFLVLIGPSPAGAAMDEPHTSIVNCSVCHQTPSSTWWTDQGATGGLCGQCHNPASGYDDAVAHNLSSKYNSASFQCSVCHDPHYQRQLRTWKPASYLTTGTVSSVDPSGAYIISSTPLTPGAYAGMLLVPNTAYVQYNYRITGNDASKINIDTTINSLNLTYAQAGKTFAISYGKLVRQTLSSKSVKFFNNTGANSFADNDTVIDGVCQVCHTQTEVFTQGGLLNGGSHPLDKAGTNCTLQCHSHSAASGGFRADCSSCHGNPPTGITVVYPALGGPDGLAKYTDNSGTGSNNVGKHLKHADSGAGNMGYDCSTCHTGYVMPQEGTKTVDLGFSNFGAGGGTYKGQAAVSYAGHGGTDVSTKDNSRTCTNIYCHSIVQTSTGGALTPNTSDYKQPVWLASSLAMTCGDCHKNMKTDATPPGSHKKHAQPPNNIACGICHSGYTDTTTVSSTHANGSIDLNFSGPGAGTTYNGTPAPGDGYSTCSTTCHNAYGATGIATPTWGQAATCGSCHTIDANGAPATGSHDAHLTNGAVCGDCHTGAVKDTNGGASHVNGTVEVADSYATSPVTKHAAGSGYSTCSTATCHVSAYGSGNVVSPTWGTPAGCGACHPIAADGAPATGSHAKHMANTTLTTDCNVCHTGALKGTSGGATHLNTTVEVADGYVGSPVAKHPAGSGYSTCSAATCHNAYGATGIATPTWGQAATCGSCHTLDANGDGAPATGGHSGHLTSTMKAGIVCGDCHTGAVKNTSGGAAHLDGNIDVADGYPANVAKHAAGSGYSSCSTANCHDAYGTGSATPVWGNLSLTCGTCHAIAADGAPATGSHAVHIDTVGAVCGDCHTGAVKDTNGGATHLNGTVEVAQGYLTSPTTKHTAGSGYSTCSTATCHGQSSPTWAANTANATCTKCHGKPTLPGSYTLANAAPGAGGTGTDTGGHTSSAQVGAHRSHLEATRGYSLAIACNECHTVPAAFNSPGHVYDGVNDTTPFVAEVPLAGPLANTNPRSVAGTPGYAAGVCSNVYCHDSSRFKNGYAGGTGHTPSWNDPAYLVGTSTDCGTCHGYPPGGGHPNDPDCKKCHTYVNATNDGFKPQGTPGVELHANGQVNGGGCDSCHGNAPVTATYSPTSPSTGMVGTALGSGDTGATSPLSPGAHDKHTNLNPVNGRQMTCDACHKGTDMSTTTSGKKIDMGFYVDNTSFPGFNNAIVVSTGTFTGLQPTGSPSMSNGFSFNASNTGTTVNTAANYDNRCSNLYCHGGGDAGNLKAALTGGTNTAPSWVGTNQAVCGTCHGGTGYTVSSASPPTTGKHPLHVSGYPGLSCDKCHKSTVDITHVNGNVAWQLDIADAKIGASAKYNGNTSGSTGGLAPSGTYQSCNNIYCHSIVQKTDGSALVADTTDYKVISWNAATPSPGCAGCHGNPSASGGHLKHAGAGSGQYSFACTDCHNGQVPPANTAVHANGVINTSIATTWGTATYNGDTTPGNGYTGSTCSNTYCHSIGIGGTSQGGDTRTVQANTSINWNSSATCSSCHGQGGDGSGRPNYPNNDVIYQNKKNSHTLTKHGSLSCDKCHNATTKDGTTIADADRPNHVNRTYNVNGPGTVPYTFTYAYNVSGGSCTTSYCHGTAAIYWGTTGSLTCNSCHQSQGADNDTASAKFAQKHEKHTSTNYYTFSCEMCHALGNTGPTGSATHVGGPATGGTNPGGDIAGANQTGEIRFRDTGATWSTGAYNGSAVTTYRYRSLYTNPFVGAVTPTYVDGTASAQDQVNSSITYTTTGSSCNTVWCHSNANPQNGTNSYTAIAWNGTAGCGSCHKTSDLAVNMQAAGTPQPLSGPHVQHVASDRYGGGLHTTDFTCNTCHSATASNNTTISSYSNHVDGTKNVSFNTFANGSATYPNYATGCSNTYCHSNGTSTTPVHAAIQWTGSMDPECDSCHGGNATSTPATGKGPIATNAHAAHTNDTGNKVGFNIGCAECHGATVSADRTLVSRDYHVNKLVNVRFDNGTRVKNGDAPTYNTQSAQSTVAGGATATPGSQAACANVYCHSVGNLSDTTGNGTVVAVGTPSVSFRTINWNTGTIDCTGCHGTSGSKAHPDYTTGGAGTTTANSHVKHVENNQYSCDTCHSTTTADTAQYPALPTTVLSSGAHLNRVEDVSIKSIGGKTGTWNGAVTFKTCTTTYCHGSTVPKWGDVSILCNGCHDATNSGGLSTRHDKHYASATAPTDRTATNAHTASAYVYGCGNCHPNGATHATGPASGVQDAEINGTKQLQANYTPAVTNLVDGRNYKYTNYGTCSTLCHTKDGLTLGSAVGGNPTWNSTNALGCGYCHNKAGDAAPTWSAPHNKHISTYSVGGNTFITCNACHSGTASDNSTINGAGGRNQHPNGNKDVAMNALVGGTVSGAQGAQQCSNIYCHGNGQSLTPTDGPISWSGTYSTCAECHGNAASLATGSHTKHLALSGVTCNNCHNATASNSTIISSYANHVNQAVTINFNAASASSSATYNGQNAGGGNVYQKAVGTGTSTCSTTICHGGVSGTWGVADPNDTCTKCHGTPTATVTAANRYVVAPPRNTSNVSGTATDTGQVSNDSKVGAHQTHLRYLNGLRATTMDTFDDRCVSCHGTLPTSGLHANGTSAPTFPGATNLATNNGAMTPTYSAGQCSNTYCHNPAGTGGTLNTLNAGSATSPTWTNAAYIADGTLQTQTNCGVCHKVPGDTGFTSTFNHTGITVAPGNCTACHGHSGDTTGIAGQRHLDGVKYGGGNCDSCHDYDTTNGGADWGKSPKAIEGWGAHAVHIEHLKAVTSTTLSASTDAFGGAAFNNVCGACHTRLTSNHDMSGTLNTRTINFGDGQTTYQFATTGTPAVPTYNGVTNNSSSVNPKTCSNVSCHYQATPVWQGF